MGADQVLAFGIVTPDSRFITASAKENADLFWAVRGGGGGTWGVVTSMIVKAYPTVPVTTAKIDFGTQANNISKEIYYKGVRSFLSNFERFCAAGTYSYWFAFLAGPDQPTF